MIRFTIPIPPVSKKNSQRIFTNRATGRPFIMPSQKYKDYEDAAVRYLPKLGHIDGPVNVKCVFYMPTRRKCDLVNMLEAAGNHTAAKQYADKAKQFRRAYDDMCAGVPGLEPRLERMRVYKNVPGKTVDNYGKSGIINTGSEFMYRKGKGNHIEPMPKKQLLRIEKCFKRRGGTIRRGDDIDDYLISKKAEAITYNQDTILLKKSPGCASVFEELIHATQYKNGDNDGSYLSRLKCEISAQEKLLKNAKAYKLTESEIKQTKIALEEYKKEIAAYKIRR